MLSSEINFSSLRIPGEAKIFLKSLSSIRFGSMCIITPEHDQYDFNGTVKGPSAKIIVNDWSLFREVLNKSDIGLAETYVKKFWETDSIENLIEFSILNEAQFLQAFTGSWPKILYYKLIHEARENTKLGSKKNIQAHYDLGNEFYKSWLDPSMTYSSGIFYHETDSLYQSQQNKYESILNMISPKDGDHILEVGCGWGGFLLFAGNKGYKVTGITISEEQFTYSQNLVAAAGLTDKVTILLCDYRELTGKFDHAVSIEMIEAVGEKYWNSYFELFRNVLRPNGKFAIQAITMNDDRFESYKKGTDFIQQYIFPGGMLLSLKSIHSICRDLNFEHLSTISFGLDYSKTLKLWNEKFDLKNEYIKALGFDDDFIRLWRFYLGYCRGAFNTERINVIQFSGRVLE